MRVLSSISGGLTLISHPSEVLKIGDFVLVEDSQGRIVLQVYDHGYLDNPDLAEDLVREELFKASSEGFEHDPLGMTLLASVIRDMRVWKCKHRGSVTKEGRLSPDHRLPSRAVSKVKRITASEALSLVGRSGWRDILLGETMDGEAFRIQAEGLDGALNIITGRKGSGKSHLAKLLVKSLVDHKAYVVVFDLNGEYEALARDDAGRRNNISYRVIKLEPGFNLKFTLDYLGLATMLNLLQHVLDMPSISMREFVRIWQVLEERRNLSLEGLEGTISNWRCNEHVREALTSRCQALKASGLFTDQQEASVKMENLISALPDGGTMIISLNRTSGFTRRLAVECILSKLIHLLTREAIPPVFLFAEEAHLYLRETYWEDVITRMRHFGLFTTFITNQPDAIDETIYRQADNIFLFNFTDEADLEMTAKASVTDPETVKTIGKHLPQGTSLILGKVVQNLPVVVKVNSMPIQASGMTKLFFTQQKLLAEEASPRVTSANY